MSVMVEEDREHHPATASVEGALVQAALEGDGRAFADLVAPHLPVLYRIARRACGDPVLAEDAVQETLLLAFQRLDRYTPDTSLRAYLAAIAVKRAHTLIRSHRRRLARETTTLAPQAVDTPEEIARAVQTEARVRLAIAKLPAKRGEAVLLRLDGKLSDAEIAMAVGSTPESIRVLVHLGLKDLKAALTSGEEP
ncbi:MAG: RNA polymerase sigma factor [Myxococcota bacterium]|nr:RNA polymerase sigma factor [Myxococcota bacterium]